MSAANFDAAVEHIRSLPKNGPADFSSAERLQFYGLFKQAKEGDVTGSQPWAVQMEARAKWDAWNKQKGKSTDDAKAEYVQLLIKVSAEKGHPWVPE